MDLMRNVVIVPSDSRWSAGFAQESQRIRAALEPLAVGLHHIGSTSVAGSPRNR